MPRTAVNFHASSERLRTFARANEYTNERTRYLYGIVRSSPGRILRDLPVVERAGRTTLAVDWT